MRSRIGGYGKGGKSLENVGFMRLLWYNGSISVKGVCYYEARGR